MFWGGRIFSKIYAESKSRLPTIPRSPICKRGAKEIYGLFDKASVEYGAVAACHWEQFQHAFGDHYRLIIINALDAPNIHEIAAFCCETGNPIP